VEHLHFRSERTALPASRREFIVARATAVAAGSLAAEMSIARAAHAAGSETIKIGFVGCGNRGTGACKEALSTKAPVQLVAMADLFADRLDRSLANLQKYKELQPRIDVPAERKFIGFDGYQQVIDAGVDLVILSTPPHFRPMQYAAAVKAGKHVFMEKPCCVDAPGYRLLVATNAAAKQKKLSVVAGLQRRHQRNYLEGIQKIRDGAVGDVLLVRTYFNMAGGREGELKPATMSEMEYQVRHWNLFCWLCGDHLVEQACHEIDVANWVVGDHPLRANGMGSRQLRVGPGTGDIYDNHMIEFEYTSGARHYCQSRQQAGTWSHVSDNVHGTKGSLTLGVGPWGLGPLTPRSLKEKGYSGDNPYQQEHDDLLASIRGTAPYRCDGDYAATSSMTAVMGRMATYSGQVVTWEEATKSDLKLAPERYAFDATPPTLPDEKGNYPVAMPGVSKAW
jgi:myo-inositol 2-dehydrogenase / D-chiro-inositol 1-dehydrogenase